MRRHWLILGIFAGGCLASNGLQYEAMSETNQYRLALVQKGMSEKQVLHIMHKPYSYESFVVDEDIYDIWFYVTRPTGLDQTRMVPQNLTPLTFKNGVLVGTGYQWYYFAMRENVTQISPQSTPVERPKTQTQKEEDVEFEKTLRSIPQKRSAQPAPTQQPPAKQEKLPPNVHIISQKEPTPSLSKVKLGMTESEVMNRLGEAENQETFKAAGYTYNVLFYQIGNKTVPLTFRDGILIGKTEEKYNQVKNECPDCYNKAGERLEEDESEQNFDYW